MDDFGNYIYLIIVVIAAISGIFKKKKKDTPKPVQAPQTPKTDIEDILREFMVDKNPVHKDPAPAVVNTSGDILEQSTMQPIISYESTTDSSVLRAKKQVVEQHSHVAPKHAEVKKPHKDFEIKVHDIQSETPSFTAEEARKAIIYAEIMNRKY